MHFKYLLLGLDRENSTVASILLDRAPLEDVAIFVQRGESRVGSRHANLLVAGYLDVLDGPNRHSYLLCAVHNSFRRAAIVAQVPNGWRFTRAVHHDAYVAPSAEIADGAIIHPRALIAHGAKVGGHTIIGLHAVIDSGVDVGPYVTVHAAAVVAAGSKIGAGCQIGAGAIVSGGITVGAWSEIAAGSVVIENVPEGAFVAGNPGVVRQASLPSA